MPSPQCRVIHSRPIIIPVQTFLCIQFLTVILIRLYTTRTCKHTTKWIVMVCFLHISIFIYNYPIVPLMILQIIVILLITQRDISFSCQQQFGSIVFIDHITTVISSGGDTSYLMNRTKFCTIRTVNISNSTAVTECYCIGQI